VAALVHQSLTNCQALSLPLRFAAPPRPGLVARLTATLRQWRRHARERQELGLLSERELRDMRLSSADVWHEIRQPFWRATRPY
jgi:uncharacterized protein YjiS (DUF1127 family)